MLWDPKPGSAEAKIKNVLNLIRNDKFEVPFITTYRKEFIKDDLDADDLWKIYLWDEKVKLSNAELWNRSKFWIINQMVPSFIIRR